MTPGTAGTVTRYEYKQPAKNSNKFWEVEKPCLYGSMWAVRVRFGRIGTEGQKHINAFYSASGAQAYYDKKVEEKLGKGYKNMTPPEGYKTLPSGIMVPLKPKEKVCEHLQLRKTGEFKWECNACKTHIEFDKPPQNQAKTVAAEEIVQVRRFIDLSALRG